VFVHSYAVRAEALALVDAGENDCAVARSLGIPRTTVRDWRHGKELPRAGATCPRCWRPSLRPIVFSTAAYSELLALYLGDGHIVRTGRSDRLRIFLDTRYGEIVADTRALLRRCFPAHRVGLSRSRKGTTTILSLYWTHLACLFPQHAPGKKHERAIVLEEWQSEIVEREPWPFLRGCIRSDGCVFVNRTGPYAYVSYEFSNRSAQIRELFMDACDRVGVEYRAYHRYVRIYRRPSVALMQQHVGVKA
jgi:Homeodomain-like domain-containing protein